MVRGGSFTLAEAIIGTFIQVNHENGIFQE